MDQEIKIRKITPQDISPVTSQEVYASEAEEQEALKLMAEVEKEEKDALIKTIDYLINPNGCLTIQRHSIIRGLILLLNTYILNEQESKFIKDTQSRHITYITGGIMGRGKANEK